MPRRLPAPTLDLAPLMGLSAVLIPMLLLGHVQPVATVDTHLPGL